MTSLLAVLRPLVLRPLLREKTRTLLTILGIAAGVSVVIAIHLSNQSAIRSFGESVEALAGEADWQITPEAGVMDETILLSLQRLWDHGGRFAPVIDTSAILHPAKTTVRLVAVDLMSDIHFREYDYATIASAEGTETGEELATFLSLFDDRSIVIPATLAEQHRIRIGDPLKLEVSGERSTLVVRGILRPRGPANAFSGSIAIADIAVAQRQFPSLRGKLTRVDIALPPDSAGIIESLGKELPAGLRLERPSQRGARVDRMLRAFRVNLFALAGVALLVGLYLVYNTVLISILRRRAEVGILKILGASPGQIFTSFLFEGVLLGTIGGLLGALLGALLARATLGLIGRTVNALYIQSDPAVVDLSPTLFTFGVVMGMIVAGVAAIQPALEAAAVRPGAMIRPGLHQTLSSRARKTLLASAAALLLLGVAATRIPPADRIAIGGYLSVFLLIAGVSLLAPAALTLFARTATVPLTRMMGVPGRLAVAGITASMRRTAVAAAALSVAVAMMIAVLVMVGSFRETVRIWVGQTVRSDLWIRPAQGLGDSATAVFPPSIADEVKQLAFVRAVDAVRSRELIWRDGLITLTSIDFDVTRQMGGLPMITPAPTTALDRALRTRGILVSESLAIHHSLSVGDIIRVPTPSGSVPLPISGIYRDYSSDRGTIMIDREHYADLWSDRSINTLAIYLREGTGTETARRQLEEALGSRYPFFAASNAVIRTEVMRIFDQTFLVTWSLLAIALFVAVVGIVNTLSALILERREEIALVRTLGVSRSQTRAMIVIESALIGIVAIGLGVVSGAAMSWVLIFVINKQSFGWTIALHPPWLLMAASLLVTMIASVLSGFLPANPADRMLLREE